MKLPVVLVPLVKFCKVTVVKKGISLTLLNINAELSGNADWKRLQLSASLRQQQADSWLACSSAMERLALVHLPSRVALRRRLERKSKGQSGRKEGWREDERMEKLGAVGVCLSVWMCALHLRRCCLRVSADPRWSQNSTERISPLGEFSHGYSPDSRITWASARSAAARFMLRWNSHMNSYGSLERPVSVPPLISTSQPRKNRGENRLPHCKRCSLGFRGFRTTVSQVLSLVFSQLKVLLQKSAHLRKRSLKQKDELLTKKPKVAKKVTP